MTRGQQVHIDITRLSSTNHGRQTGEIKIRSIPFEVHKAGEDRERFFPFQLGIVNNYRGVECEEKCSFLSGYGETDQ